MSDFPKGQGVEATRAWLNSKGFRNVLIGWEADALLGADKADILAMVPGDDGFRIWGLLNTARNKTIFLSDMDLMGHEHYDLDEVPNRESVVTKERFERWGDNLQRLWVVGPDEKIHLVKSFAAIEEGKIYFLTGPKDAFAGFARAEADIQTRDVLDCIKKGFTGDDGVLAAFTGGTVEKEYAIKIPDVLHQTLPSSQQKLITPDGVIFKDNSVLFLESKHCVTEKEALRFKRNCDLLTEHIREPWVTKHHKREWPALPDKAVTVVPAMCSVASFPENVLTNPKLKGMTWLIRKGLKFVKV